MAKDRVGSVGIVRELIKEVRKLKAECAVPDGTRLSVHLS